VNFYLKDIDGNRPVSHFKNRYSVCVYIHRKWSDMLFVYSHHPCGLLFLDYSSKKSSLRYSPCSDAYI